jgi:ABC-type antimicrobial peptide transport system permease subunit
VNQAFARQFFPSGDPVGQRVRFNDKGDRQWSTIVGVVADSPQKSPAQAPLPELDYNLMQLLPQDEMYPILGAFYMNVAVRSVGDPQVLIGELTHAIHQLDPDSAVKMQPMTDVVDDAMGNEVLAARLMGLFAAAGLVIALAGIYGLLAYSVSQRTREMGVRLALGAQRGDVQGLILRHAARLLGAGVILGMIATLAASKVVISFMAFKVSVYDALTGLGVALLFVACGLAASYLPARKAASIDPVVALRTE